MIAMVVLPDLGILEVGVILAFAIYFFLRGFGFVRGEKSESEANTKKQLFAGIERTVFRVFGVLLFAFVLVYGIQKWLF